jgi:hypothetical protein
MRDFNKVNPMLWQAPWFKALPTDDAKVLYLYILTSMHQNSAGTYPLPEGYAGVDLQWASERFQTARDTLVAANILHFDADTSEVFLEYWFWHNPLQNGKHRTGTARLIQRILSHELRHVVGKAFKAASGQNWEAEPTGTSDLRPVK